MTDLVKRATPNAGVLSPEEYRAGADRVRGEQPLVPYPVSAKGKPELVPDGAEGRVQAVYNAAGDSIVTLHVRGLLPDQDYGAHAHVGSCGIAGADAGPHFQHSVDPEATPEKPSTSPAYANPGPDAHARRTHPSSGRFADTATSAPRQRRRPPTPRRSPTPLRHRRPGARRAGPPRWPAARAMSPATKSCSPGLYPRPRCAEVDTMRVTPASRVVIMGWFPSGRWWWFGTLRRT